MSPKQPASAGSTGCGDAYPTGLVISFVFDCNAPRIIMRSVPFVLAAAVLAAAFCQGAGDDVASGVPLVFEPEVEWKEIQPGQQIPGVSCFSR